jgi:hypothetical protein
VPSYAYGPEREDWAEMGGGSRGTADDDGDNVDGYSRHVVLCDGRIIAGPCSSEGASGTPTSSLPAAV